MSTVLVVDDEPNVRELIKVILECEGYDVLTAGDGPEALDIARDAQPDLVTLDVMMPGMSGFEVGQRMAADPDLASIRRLVVSAKPLHELDGDAHRNTVHAVLTKPFNFVAFVDAVENVLLPAA